MTTIAPASYYGTRYAGYDKTNSTKSEQAYSLPGDQEAKARTGSDTRVDSRPSSATFKFMGRVIDATNLAVDLKPMNISELPEDEYQSFIEGEAARIEANRKYLEMQHTQFPEPPDLSDYPGNKPYATVTVDGRVVATIFNDGSVQTDDNALGSKLKDILKGSINGTNGPDLAQDRADQIADMFGGRISKSATALTQPQYAALPKIVVQQPTIDYEAMMSDPLYAQLQKQTGNLEILKQQREAFLSQQ
ncbi:MAG: hypothetical protein AAAB19_18225 [Rhizobium sp.]|jgi:hypothetical protein